MHCSETLPAQLGLSVMSLEQEDTWEVVPCQGRCWILPERIPNSVKIASKPFLQRNSARCSPCTTLGTGASCKGDGMLACLWGEGSDPNPSGSLGGRQRLSPSPAPPWAAQHRTASLSAISARRSLRKAFSGSVPTARGQQPEPPGSPLVPAPASSGGAAEQHGGDTLQHYPGRAGTEGEGNPARAGRAPE